MTDSSHIGATIRARRVELGLTCAALARRTSLSYSLMNKIERGDREGSDIAITKIARVLGGCVDELVEPHEPADVA